VSYPRTDGRGRPSLHRNYIPKQKPGWLTRLFNSDREDSVTRSGQIFKIFLSPRTWPDLKSHHFSRLKLHDQCQVLQLQLKDWQRATGHLNPTSCIQSRLRGNPVAPAHQENLQ